MNYERTSRMNAYMCTVCGYVYDQESSEKTEAGRLIPFQELPEDWMCPVCGVGMDLFELTDSDRTPDVPAD